MLRSMYIATSTMGQLQQKLDVVSNNISNVDTNGFKKREASFGSLLTQQLDNGPSEIYEPNTARETPLGIRAGTGAYMNGTKLILDAGSIKQTGRALDIALSNEKQFLQVAVTKNGETQTMYSRDGALQLAATTNPDFFALTNSEGYPIIGENGNIFIPVNSTDIKINQNGEILVTGANGETSSQRLAVVEMIQPQILQNEGGNLYRLPEENALTATMGQLVQNVQPENIGLQVGALEGSNVDMGNEMSELMLTQRAYQFNSRAVTMSDQMLGLVNNLRS